MDNKSKKKKIDRLTKADIGTHVIKIEDLEKLEVEEQVKHFEDIFSNIYSNKEIESIRKYALRTIKLTCDPKDNKIHLPYGVMVQKKENKLYIKTYKNRHIFLILLFLTILLLSILGASYSTVNYSIIKNFNKDIDGDGIPDINLNLDGDMEADVNIDINNDNKPELNIDYKGNRKPVFNIDRNKNGKPDFNLINVDKNNDGKCDINCDVNGDGWPDINLDTNGDGRLDLNIDTDNDKKADLNFDENGDLKCDLHCDLNSDYICDKYCLSSPQLEEMDPNDTGSSSNNGYNNILIQSGELILEYEDGGEILVKDLFPIDQHLNPSTPDVKIEVPTKKFKVTNKSMLNIRYNIRLVVERNDFTTNNFEYRLLRNDVVRIDWTTAPKENIVLQEGVVINSQANNPGQHIQDYKIEFRLRGAGDRQNEDQGKTFMGHVEIYLDR